MEAKGTPVSKGIAVGPVFIYEIADEVSTGLLSHDEIDQQLAECQCAKEQAHLQLEKLVKQLQETAPAQAEIFEAHIDILGDEEMGQEIVHQIQQCVHPAQAIHAVFGTYAEIIAASQNELLRERAADFVDVRRRWLNCLAGRQEKQLSSLEEPVVVVAKDLLPSDTVGLDREKVLGIVTELGGVTSHSAIIARHYEIPCVTGVASATHLLCTGDTVIVDALDGKVISHPDKKMQKNYAHKKTVFATSKKEEKTYRARRAVTTDGQVIEIELNIGSGDEAELQVEPFVDGVGLFRTEFLYMGRETLPSEQEQYESYKRVLTAFGEKPVVLRTLDIGGDKEAKCLTLPREQNPFLGNRALRFCLSRPEIFKTQLRAALRASVHGTLWLMFPMVAGFEDVIEAKKVLEDVKNELTLKGIAYRTDVKVGIMIEIPAVALVADKVAPLVDFASIGTNDLCQYLNAADRLNPDTEKYYRSCHPGLFRLIGHVAEEFQKVGKELSVCGEMASEPSTALALIGLGIQRLSMGASAIASIKKMICHLCTQNAGLVAQEIQNVDTQQQVQAVLADAVCRLDKERRT